MMRFNYTISHVPGKQLVIADTLSRAPVSTPTESDERFIAETDAFIHAVVKSLLISEQRLENMRSHQEQDEACKLLMSYCHTGWPDKKMLPEIIRPYYPRASEISVTEQLLMRQNRIIIPGKLRAGVLEEIHSGHQGINKCRARAEWWPGLARDLESLVNN